MSNKNLYIEYSGSPGAKVSLFHQPWWLDAACGENNWDVCLVARGNDVLAYMPYYVTKKYVYKLLSMPPLTPYLGPELAAANREIAPGEIKKIYTSLISQLPDFDFFNQSFRPGLTNWLPFFWSGFRQTTRYTYRLPGTLTADAVWENFEGRVRNDIRKARDKHKLVIRESDDAGQIYALNRKSLQRNNKHISFDMDLLARLDDVCSKHQQRKIYLAVDQENNVYAGIYIVWDDNCVYYLVGGIDESAINTGANSLLLWEAIQFSLQQGKNFDFEGSMLPGVEKYFRGFNAELTEYHRVYKANSIVLRHYLIIKSGF